MKGNQNEKLVQAVLDGNQASFEELYENTKNTVYFICINFLNNEEDAKDIVQDVYLTAYSKLYQLKEKDKFDAWVNQIAVNKCKKFLMKTAPVLLETEDLENLKIEDNENFLPEDYITKKEKRKIVMDIMREQLSRVQYETVILFYFNGLSIEEIADIMECPPGTVKYRLSVARGKIKEGVLEYENINDDKLYSVVGIPFLTGLLTAEVVGLEVPDLYHEIYKSLSAGVVDATAASQATTEATYATAQEFVNTTVAPTGPAAVPVTATVTKVGLATLKVKLLIGAAAIAIIAIIAFLVAHNINDNKDSDIEATQSITDIEFVDATAFELGDIDELNDIKIYIKGLVGWTKATNNFDGIDVDTFENDGVKISYWILTAPEVDVIVEDSEDNGWTTAVDFIKNDDGELVICETISFKGEYGNNMNLAYRYHNSITDDIYMTILVYDEEMGELLKDTNVNTFLPLTNNEGFNIEYK